jgi:hypothetical protein
MATKKTNELKGAAKDRAKKVFGGEKKGLSKKLSDFVSGVKKRKAEADKKASDKVKAKKTTATAKKKPTAAPGSTAYKPTKTNVGPNYGATTRKTPKRAAGSEGYKPTKTNQGPNMSRGTKAKKTSDANKSAPATKKRMEDKKAAQKKVNKRRGPSGPSMTGFGR